MTDSSDIHICWTLDCEATQRAVADVDLGQRAVQGFVDTVTAAGMRVTLFVLPGDARAYPRLLRNLAGQGVEVGLHFHPQEEGHADYCGAYAADEQRQMYAAAIRQFADALGFQPRAFRTGSCSANDSTFPVTAALGFDSCSHSMPGRNMAGLRSSWTGAPACVHYAHAANRLLAGGLDLVEVPLTTDTDTMLWSGGHPQDLRVELFDAKQQRYLLDKVIGREKATAQPVKAIVALSHNTFAYDKRGDFRRQTLEQMLTDCTALADKHQVTLRPATIGDVAKAHRQAMPLGAGSKSPST
ncbi:MAG: polysaccharide deacetylase family protein [Planctomycetia bacterium]|nr:polysaccharide deacetylase family protein [Planctomycetia bacterium]